MAGARRILVVEDDDYLAALILIMLTMEGFVGEAVEDAETALVAISMRRPDLILLDYMLPGRMTGVDLWRLLQANPDTARIPIIFVTAYRDGPRRQLAAEFVLILEKPFERHQLIAIIANVLGLEKEEAHGS